MSLNVCSNPINNSMLVRIIVTILSIFLISVNLNSSIIKNKLYLILPLLLTILDETDNIYTYSLTYKGKENGCTKTFDYQIKDKIVDSLSYIYTNYILHLDNDIYVFIIYRLIGVLLFGITKMSIWLIIFFDFVKEFMLYKYIFSNDLKYLSIPIIIKIIFEYYFHSRVNKKVY